MNLTLIPGSFRDRSGDHSKSKNFEKFEIKKTRIWEGGKMNRSKSAISGSPRGPPFFLQFAPIYHSPCHFQKKIFYSISLSFGVKTNWLKFSPSVPRGERFWGKEHFCLMNLTLIRDGYWVESFPGPIPNPRSQVLRIKLFQNYKNGQKFRHKVRQIYSTRLSCTSNAMFSLT